MGHEQGLSGSFRWIPEKPDSGQIFVSVSYEFLPNVSAGIDYRPLSDDLAPNGTWRVFPEQKPWPALILGTSNDDFGDEQSQAIFGTFSKYIGRWASLEVSPYAGGVWIIDLDEVNLVGGVYLRRIPLAAMLMYSGTDAHAVLSTSFGNHTLSAILFALELPGLGYGRRW